MASNIVPGNIDGAFPVAGQDNSSQGFRDNFTAIKNNFTQAKTEIENIQTNKADTNASTLNHENGHYQTLTTNAAVTLAFTNFPSASMGRIILDITYGNTAHTLTVTSATLAADNVTGFDAGTNIVTISTAGRYLYEFVTPDGGTTVLMHQIGKLYTTT